MAWAGVLLGGLGIGYAAMSGSHWHPAPGIGVLALGVMYLTRRIRASDDGLEAQLVVFKRSLSWDQIETIKVDYTSGQIIGFVDGEPRIAAGPVPSDMEDRRMVHAVLRDRVDTVEVVPPSVDK